MNKTQEAFEKWLKYIDADLDGVELNVAKAAWQAAKADSAQEIAKLEKQIVEMTADAEFYTDAFAKEIRALKGKQNG